MAAPTNVLVQYTMQGQLLTNSGPNAYEWVYWDVFNLPDLTGAQSGYFGQLQNIAIAAQANISSPTSAAVTPTSAAGGDLSLYYPNPLVVGIQGNAIVGLPIAGQGLLFNGTTINWITPTIAARPTPRVSVSGGAPSIPVNAESWDESASPSVRVTYTMSPDAGTFDHWLGWLSGVSPSLAPPAGWQIQSPVDGLLRSTAYVYGTGGNGAGERYIWRMLIASSIVVPL